MFLAPGMRADIREEVPVAHVESMFRGEQVPWHH